MQSSVYAIGFTWEHLSLKFGPELVSCIYTKNLQWEWGSCLESSFVLLYSSEIKLVVLNIWKHCLPWVCIMIWSDDAVAAFFLVILASFRITRWTSISGSSEADCCLSWLPRLLWKLESMEWRRDGAVEVEWMLTWRTIVQSLPDNSCMSPGKLFKPISLQNRLVCLFED